MLWRQCCHSEGPRCESVRNPETGVVYCFAEAQLVLKPKKPPWRGKIGPAGAKGATGATGVGGARGEAGPVGPDNHLNVLVSVHDQIDRIHHELDVQMKRMAQLQAELDEVRATLKRLMGESH